MEIDVHTQELKKEIRDLDSVMATVEVTEAEAQPSTGLEKEVEKVNMKSHKVIILHSEPNCSLV